MAALRSPYGDEATLVAALIARDPAAAGAAWDLYSPLVRSLLWQSLAVGADVDDLTQDVFLHLFRRIGGLRDPNALRSFVVGIAIRVARSELRRRRVRRWLRLTDTGELPDEPTMGDDHGAREALRRVYAILDKVDDESRLAFVLRYVQGLELTEVATALDISLATTKRRIAHVHERIAVHARGDASLAPFLGERGDDDRASGARTSDLGKGTS
jgi:RNA polymerase sigma-70 factor (ECF subfamily)